MNVAGETKTVQLAVERVLAQRAGAVTVLQVLLQPTQRYVRQRINVAKVRTKSARGMLELTVSWWATTATPCGHVQCSTPIHDVYEEKEQ